MVNDNFRATVTFVSASLQLPISCKNHTAPLPFPAPLDSFAFASRFFISVVTLEGLSIKFFYPLLLRYPRMLYSLHSGDAKEKQLRILLSTAFAPRSWNTFRA